MMRAEVRRVDAQAARADAFGYACDRCRAAPGVAFVDGFFACAECASAYWARMERERERQ